jgi:hypothetical protein
VGPAVSELGGPAPTWGRYFLRRSSHQARALHGGGRGPHQPVAAGGHARPRGRPPPRGSSAGRLRSGPRTIWAPRSSRSSAGSSSCPSCRTRQKGRQGRGSCSSSTTTSANSRPSSSSSWGKRWPVAPRSCSRSGYTSTSGRRPSRTHQCGSVDDIMQAVDRGFGHRLPLLRLSVLSTWFAAGLGVIDQLRKRCRVVTDPFLGMLSKQDPAFIRSKPPMKLSSPGTADGCQAASRRTAWAGLRIGADSAGHVPSVPELLRRSRGRSGGDRRAECRVLQRPARAAAPPPEARHAALAVSSSPARL